MGRERVYGFVYVVAMTDTDLPPMQVVSAIIKAAKASAGTRGAGVNANISAPPPMPVPGVDKPREIAELRTETLKVRNLYINDDQGRKRIALSASVDDAVRDAFISDATGHGGFSC